MKRSRSYRASSRLCNDCLKGESLVFTVVATGLQEAYENLRPPIDAISYLRPVIVLLYLVVAASAFAAAVARRKSAVFGMVLLAALIATGANIASLKAYLEWNPDNSFCQDRLLKGQIGFDRVAESALKKFAADLNDDKEDYDSWDVTYRAEGRVLIHTYRSKKPLVGIEAFHRTMAQLQKDALERYCSNEQRFLRDAKATQTYTYYSVEGERLTSFSIGPADCPQW